MELEEYDHDEKPVKLNRTVNLQMNQIKLTKDGNVLLREMVCPPLMTIKGKLKVL